VDFVGGDVGWAVLTALENRIVRTTDGGDSWTDTGVEVGSGIPAFFLDPLHTWVANGEGILHLTTETERGG